MEKRDFAIFWFMVICCLMGVFFASVALGCGLIFLSLQRAIGLAILAFGAGAIYGASVEAKRIVRAVVETIKEMEAEEAASKG